MVAPNDENTNQKHSPELFPGYAEAILEERRRRNWVEGELPDTVCGVPLRPLTLTDVTILQESGVCFFDDSPDAHNPSLSLVLLLWWQWTHRPTRPNLLLRICALFRPSLLEFNFLKRRFARAVGIVSTDTASKEISEWLDWQFADAPPHRTGGKGAGGPLTSFAVSVCDMIATRCAWPRHEIMKMPLPVIWQHLKLAARDANPKAPGFNRSDSAKTDFLRNMNKRAGL